MLQNVCLYKIPVQMLEFSLGNTLYLCFCKKTIEQYLLFNLTFGWKQELVAERQLCKRFEVKKKDVYSLPVGKVCLLQS